MSPSATQQQRREASLQRLVDAALAVLAERGYAGATLAGIGERAGVSRSLVTHYFGSKEQCVRTVVDEIRRRMHELAQVSNDRPGLRSIDRLFDAYFVDDSRHVVGARALFAVLSEALTTTPALQAAVAAHNEACRAAIEGHLTDAVARGEIDASRDVAADALVILGVLRGVLQQLLADRDRLDFGPALQAAKQFVRAALGAEAATSGTASSAAGRAGGR